MTWKKRQTKLLPRELQCFPSLFFAFYRQQSQTKCFSYSRNLYHTTQINYDHSRDDECMILEETIKKSEGPDQEQTEQNQEEEEWMTSYRTLVDCLNLTGNTRDENPTELDTTLKDWLKNQQEQFLRWKEGNETSTMTSQREKLLDETKLEWKKSGNKNDDVWLERYLELEAFYLENKHCLVPRGLKENKQLGEWVSYQRRVYSEEKMDPRKINMLHRIEFVWNPYSTIWTQHYSELKKYKKKHGDCLVPHRYEDNPALGNWVVKQRQAYKRFQEGTSTRKSNSLIQKHIEKLNELDFVWNVAEYVWLQRFKELEDYKKKYGDCLVPSKYEDNQKLGNWVATQRKLYIKLQEGKRSSMTINRKQKLDELGFVWKPKKKSE